MEDGSAYQYQPLTKRGNSDIGSGFNDDPLWLIAAAAAYIRKQATILFLRSSFKEETAVPLMEHLRRSFNFTVTHR